MIIETVLSFSCYIIQGLFSGLQFFTLPVDYLTVLLDILCYGVWVIGADLMALTIVNITGWLTFKFGAGLILFIWRLLPLT